MSAVGVRRGKAAFFSACKSHPATIAPAGNNQSSHGGDEMAEAFGIACYELVSLDFRCGSRAVHRRHHQEGLFLGVEPTKSERKRTSATEFPGLGVDRTRPGHGWNFAC